MIRPQSSLVKEMDYDPATQVLDVTLASGARYRYADVAHEHYRAMANSPSVGRYLNEHIKAAHAAERVEEEA